MATPSKNPWKAMIVLGSDHAGLKHHFQRLEDELRFGLDRIDDPRKVIDYMRWLLGASAHWLEINADVLLEK
jgi:hypothetical protein